MSRLTDLIAQAKAKDIQLGADFGTSAFNASLANEVFAAKRPEIVSTSLRILSTYFQRFTNQGIRGEAKIVDRAAAMFPFAKNVWARPKVEGLRHP